MEKQFEMFKKEEMSPIVLEDGPEAMASDLFPEAFEYVQVYMQHGAQGVEYLTGLAELRSAMTNPDFAQWAGDAGFDYQKCQSELTQLHRQ